MQSRLPNYTRLLSQKHLSAVPCSFYHCYWQISENVETVQYIFVKLFILSYQKCATRLKRLPYRNQPIYFSDQDDEKEAKFNKTYKYIYICIYLATFYKYRRRPTERVRNYVNSLHC